MSLPPEAISLPQRLIDCCGLLSDRVAMLPLLPKRAVFAEVGVALGDFSELVLSVCEPALFIAIDNFRLHEQQTFWGRSAQEVFGGRTHGDAYRTRFAAAIEAGRMRVLEGDSAEALDGLAASSIDIVYIDADHEYESVRRDLAAAHRVVRDDGWLILNDYIMVPGLHETIPYGVVHAANEFMMENDWGIQYLALQTRMFFDVALRPARFLQRPEARLAGLSAENQRLQSDLASLRDSTSWRVTAPARSMSRLVRKLSIIR